MFNSERLAFMNQLVCGVKMTASATLKNCRNFLLAAATVLLLAEPDKLPTHQKSISSRAMK